MKKLAIRVLVLVLAASVCLSLAGCAPKDEKDFERACALMEAGEYEAAIEAFSAIGMYREIHEKIGEAQELLDEENAEFLYGDWVNLTNKDVYTFSKDGVGILTHDTISVEFSYTSDGRTVQIQGPITVDLKAGKEDGVIHLKDDSGRYDLVAQEDFAESGPVTVEITLENWETYFEGRDAQDVGVDSEGRVNFREIGYGIFLKEEYLSKLDPDAGDIEVTFEVEYGYRPHLLEGDLQSDSYQLTPARLPKEMEAYRGRFPATMPIHNRGYQLWRSPESDFNNAVCGFIGAEIVEQDGITYVMVIDKVTVTGVTGTLTLVS